MSDTSGVLLIYAVMSCIVFATGAVTGVICTLAFLQCGASP